MAKPVRASESRSVTETDSPSAMLLRARHRGGQGRGQGRNRRRQRAAVQLGGQLCGDSVVQDWMAAALLPAAAVFTARSVT